MTSKSDKMRGLFLAAIMVTSVFVGSIAFAGTAAAAANAVSVDSAVEYNSGNVELVLNDTADGAGTIDEGNVQVYVDGTQIIEDGDSTGNLADFNSDITTVDGFSGDTDRVEFDLGADVTPNRNLTVVIEDVDDDANTATNDLVAKDLTVTSQDISQIGSDKRTYQGETVAIVADTAQSSGTDVVIDGPSGVVLDGNTGDNSKVLTRSTENLELGGEYQVDFGSTGTFDRNFTVNNLQLSAEAVSTDVTAGDDIEVDASAIRGPAGLTVEVDGPEDSSVSNTTGSLDGNGEASFDLPTEDDSDDYGDYVVTVIDNRTGIEASTDTITVSEGAESDAAFENVETEQRGDIANITVSLTGDATHATLALGTDNSAYETNVTVEDKNEDGEVTLQWNSFLADNRSANNPAEIGNNYDAGGDDIQWSAVGDDEVTGTNVSTEIGAGPQHVIATGTYTMNVKPGQSTVERATDRSTITLEERDSSSVQLWTAPAGADEDISSVSDITDAADAGTLTQTEDIAKNDVLVAQITAEGLEGAFENQTRVSDGDTEAWYNLTANQTVYLNHTEQVGSSSNQSPAEIKIAAGTSGVSVIGDADSDTYYVIHDTDDISAIEADETYNTEFRFTSQGNNSANFGLIAPNADDEFEDEVTETSFEVSDGSATIDTEDDMITVSQADGQEISGTSTYAPGTELDLVIQSESGSSSQFVIDPETFEVSEDGTWSVTANFSSYNVGSTFTADLTKASDGSDEDVDVDGEIRGPPEVISLEFSDQERRGEVVVVDSVELNDGGFVAIHEGSASGDVIGVSDYIDENDATQNLRITLDEPLDSDTTLVAMPHLDTNGNEEFDFNGSDVDGPYTENGSAVTATANYSVEGSEADFQVSNLDPTEATATAGDTVDVSATVSNEGNAEGTQTVELQVDGTSVDSEEVTLGAGENATVEFSADTSGLEAGDLTHGVYTDDSSQEGTLTVESDGGDETPTPTPTPEPSDDDGTATAEPSDDDGDDTETTEGESGPGFGIIVSVLALLGAALLAARRNN
ncbi:DUF7282 domain-containing protein [Salinibaculum salinum]|uniref:DUF7282 domain-containing protein n=1 Tax=Salinibaculum salinum TaxID=3131996 RepID=UPI0030EC5FF2